MAKKNSQGDGGNTKRESAYSNHNISGIAQHEHRGKTLRPPLNKLQTSNSSWVDDHMPEMLWGVLLTACLKREDYLACFRALAVLAREWFKQETDGGGEEAKEFEQRDVEYPDCDCIADLTTLSEVSEAEFKKFTDILLSHPLGIGTFRPLLLLESLPGKGRWEKALGDAEPTNSDWRTLGNAVAGVLDHQSERSTDIRWFKVAVGAISGRVIFLEEMQDVVEELRLYPNKGDLRRVRPFVRSSEMMLRRNPTKDWVEKFWREVLAKTGCIDPSVESEYELIDTHIDRDALYKTRFEVVKHFHDCLSPMRVDSRLDSSFGFVLYALALVEEVALHRLHNRISGRLVLRAIVEAFIYFKWLSIEDDESLWTTFRIYGAGQAKLAFLKAQQVEDDLPAFLDEDTLYSIANEDVWQEFLDIDVGHWAKADLRKLAKKCDLKHLYDNYYDWTSAYAHANWGAIRDTNFVTCHNPLHRLHRIPRAYHRNLPALETDAITICNSMLDLLVGLYPRPDGFSKLKTIQINTSG